MTKLRYVHWQEEDYHLGYFEDYPGNLSRGETPAELSKNLGDLCRDIHSGQVPCVRKVGEMILTG